MSEINNKIQNKYIPTRKAIEILGVSRQYYKNVIKTIRTFEPIYYITRINI